MKTVRLQDIVELEWPVRFLVEPVLQALNEKVWQGFLHASDDEERRRALKRYP